MKIRLHDTEEECREAVELLERVMLLQSVSRADGHSRAQCHGLSQAESVPSRALDSTDQPDHAISPARRAGRAQTTSKIGEPVLKLS